MTLRMTDDILIERSLSGDVGAFRVLYERYVPTVSRRVTRLLGPGASDRDDVVQEAFIQIHRSLHRFRLGEPFSPWAGRIATNVTISHLRRKPATVDLTALRSFALSHEEWGQLSARDRCRVLYAALDQVDENARRDFVLHMIEGMGLREIAEQNNESINTVAARVRRTRERLRLALERAERSGNRRYGGRR